MPRDPFQSLAGQLFASYPGGGGLLRPAPYLGGGPLSRGGVRGLNLPGPLQFAGGSGGGGRGGGGFSLKGLTNSAKNVPWGKKLGRGFAGLTVGSLLGDLAEEAGLPGEVGSVITGAGAGFGVGGPIGGLIGGGVGLLSDVLGFDPLGLFGGEDAPTFQDIRPDFKRLKETSPATAAQIRNMWRASKALPGDQRDQLRMQVSQSIPSLIVQEQQQRQLYNQQMMAHARAAQWLDKQLTNLYRPYGVGFDNGANQQRINDTVKSFMAAPLVQAYEAQAKAGQQFV